MRSSDSAFENVKKPQIGEFNLALISLRTGTFPRFPLPSFWKTYLIKSGAFCAAGIRRALRHSSGRPITGAGRLTRQLIFPPFSDEFYSTCPTSFLASTPSPAGHSAHAAWPRTSQARRAHTFSFLSAKFFSNRRKNRRRTSSTRTWANLTISFRVAAAGAEARSLGTRHALLARSQHYFEQHSLYLRNNNPLYE